MKERNWETFYGLSCAIVGVFVWHFSFLSVGSVLYSFFIGGAFFFPGMAILLSGVRGFTSSKIAVCSPNISNLGGVSRSVIVLIESLNKQGIVPDYYGIDSDKKKIKGQFNREIEYNFKKIHWPNKFILYSSWMKNLILYFKRYDYVFDFTNTLPWYKNEGNYFFYALYPEYLTSRGKYNKGFWKVYYLPHKMMAYLTRNAFKKGEIDIFCVSKKTSDLIKEYSGINYPVLYPPTNLKDFRNKKSCKNGIVSVGGFTHEKNQLEQIDIAKHFPKVRFNLLGNANRNKIYFRELQEKAKSQKNVTLHPNLQFNELREVVASSDIFLNTGIEDPFSMALIEGIYSGCIPLIRNSGGITEIVPYNELKFYNMDDAIKKLKAILALTKKEKDTLRKSLKKNVEQFSEENFVNALMECMSNTLQKRKIYK